MNEPAEPQIKDIEASVPSDEERDLAANALSEFQKGAYALCLTYLNRLEALRPKDVKVMHNKVVAEYYKSDLKKTELVKKSLNAMCGELISTDTADAADVVEKCVMRYNQAILLYHTRQYNAALQIMSRLFSLIEPLVSEESLAQKVCLLLIELYIATAQSDAALTLVNYIERQFSVSDLPKISSTDKEGLIKPAREEKEIKTDSSDIATDAFRMRLAKCKIRIYLITHQLKLCKKEWKAFTSMGTNMNLANIYLAANVEYLRGKCKKAITLLNAFTTEQREFKAYGESAAVLYYNNMASIHQALGKPNLACFYLQKALEQNKKATENLQIDEKDTSSSQPLCTLGGNKHYELVYSLGICYLYAGQHIKAFDCLTEAAQILQNSPRLWLRMAECCIFNYNPKNELNFNILKRRQDVVQKVVVSEFHKKIILSSSLSNNTKYQSDSLSHAIPQPTLEFGMLCLKNALYLLSSNAESVPSQVIAGQHAVRFSQITAIETLNLKISILADSAYVSLCLGEYSIALEYAKSLLALNNLPGAYTMLGKLYTAESLIFLDKINEALDYLRPEMLTDLITSLPIPDTLDKDKEKSEEIDRKPIKVWYPTNILTGKAVLLYNMAVAYAIRGQLDRSGEIVGQLWKSKGTDYDIPIHVIMLALYIELQLGRTDKWRSIIKRNYPQYF
ncbi:CCR4-NOT transcription complex subunit 10 isoform X2 [Belonocnema kinseyi]|nr:CCR4-NOT transcription complex subunit 10 isoform X2 [Belonocnema kinseyi]XP_033221853.1 CCR4-NOT transcription complex subunit 10 isoform X2 [Belonocnema kinseyi]XP_033221854.1 CCR4-NOT transcription complex subunit 10 isoform X2 [Belonocnema kinseyi]XP_033221855.1 CCR4-NOT transcription complex subunit 10 isoform X2 [Belonocnema kinseyi]